MKDGFMILVLILVMITPMFPFLLKSKCPKCNKRKLEHLETEQRGNGKSMTYVTSYHCHACGADFERNKSGPLKPVQKQEAKVVSAVQESGTTQGVAAVDAKSSSERRSRQDTGAPGLEQNEPALAKTV